MHLTVNRVAAGLLTVTVIFVLARMVLFHYHLIVYPYQGEFREGADLLLTTAFAQGIDPYALASQPQVANAYGFVGNLLTAPLVAQFGPSFAIGRGLTALATLLSCGLLIAVLRRLRVPLLFCLVAAILVDASLITDGYPILARADGLGLLLFLASVCVAWLGDYSPGSLFASLIFAVLAFYSKIYFVLGAGVLTAFLFLFVSKRAAIAYGLGLAALLLASAWLIDQRADLYFSNALFAHANAAGDNIRWALEQLRRFAAFFGWLWLALLALSILTAFLARRELARRIRVFPAGLRGRVQLDVLHPALPLIRGGNHPLALFGLALVVSVALLFLKLNRHQGAGTTYDFQLAGPFVVLIVFALLAKMHRIQAVVSLALIPVVLLTGQSQIAALANGPADSSDWARLAEVISTRRSVLNSPAIVGLLIENRLPVYDSGSSEYFDEGYDAQHDVRSHYDDYKARLSALVQQRAFDLIVINPGRTRLIDADEVAQYYRRVETLTLPMPYSFQFWLDRTDVIQSWPTELWVPDR